MMMKILIPYLINKTELRDFDAENCLDTGCCITVFRIKISAIGDSLYLMRY